MATAAQERREKLGGKLVEAATARIAEDGLSSLRARDLAKDAGCAVGAIYTVFRDMDELILQANAVTFRELGGHVIGAVRAAGDAPPLERLIVMAHAYLDFAEKHTRRWLALFDVSVPADAALPDWYRAEIGQLFAIIRDPLVELRPDQTEEERRVFVRTLFSAIHGIVLLGVQTRISAVPPEHLRGAIAMLLTSATRA